MPRFSPFPNLHILCTMRWNVSSAAFSNCYDTRAKCVQPIDCGLNSERVNQIRISSVVCVCVYIQSCVRVCVCIPLYTSGCTCVCRLEVNLRFCSPVTAHFIFWDRISSEPGTHRIGKAGWPGGHRNLPVSASTTLGLQGHITTSSFFLSCEPCL